jgi:hypothetical protein
MDALHLRRVHLIVDRDTHVERRGLESLEEGACWMGHVPAGGRQAGIDWERAAVVVVAIKLGASGHCRWGHGHGSARTRQRGDGVREEDGAGGRFEG